MGPSRPSDPPVESVTSAADNHRNVSPSEITPPFSEMAWINRPVPAPRVSIRKPQPMTPTMMPPAKGMIMHHHRGWIVWAASKRLVPLPQIWFCKNASTWATATEVKPTTTPTTGNKKRKAFSLGVRRDS